MKAPDDGGREPWDGYANLRIGKKLAGGFSVIIILSILLGIIGIQGMRKMDDTMASAVAAGGNVSH